MQVEGWGTTEEGVRWGMKRGLRTGLGDARLLTFSQPIYHQCHPPNLHGDRRDRARAKAAVSQAGCVSLLQDLTLAWACRSQHPAATAGPGGGQKDKASAPG